MHNLSNQTVRLGNGIFVKSNIKLFVEFTNGDLSRKFVEHGTFSFQPSERACLSLVITVPNGKSKLEADFFLQ